MLIKVDSCYECHALAKTDSIKVICDDIYVDKRKYLWQYIVLKKNTFNKIFFGKVKIIESPAGFELMTYSDL